MRSRSLLVLTSACLLLASGCDWTQFGYLASGSRHTPDEGLTTANAAAVGFDWHLPGNNQLSSPAVAGGKVFVGRLNDLIALDAAGVTNCETEERQCNPLWIGNTGGVVQSSPAVAGGTVFVGSLDHKLYAFDAAGVTNCTPGTPTTCAPLWTATTGAAVYGSPTVVNGKVYVGSDDGNLYVFDAAGSTNCSGMVKVCQPLWTGTVAPGGRVRSTPAIGDGRVYVSGFSAASTLAAFDADGTTNCSGGVCQPLWKATSSQGNFGSPAFAYGKVYIGGGELYVYDAAGDRNCSGSPTICEPLWVGVTGGSIVNAPAIAGNVYVGSIDGKVYAFSQSRRASCTGVPVMCPPLGTSNDIGSSIASAPALVGPNLLYVGADDGSLYAFDGPGIATGTNAGPLGVVEVAGPVYQIRSSPAVANGEIYVSTGNGFYTFKPYFSSPVVYGAGQRSETGAVADFDGVNGPDLALTSYGDFIFVLLNNGHGKYADPVTYDSSDPDENPDTSYYAAVGDFDGANGPDLAVTNHASDKVALLFNHGDGTFAAPVNYTVGSSPDGVAVGNFDGVNGPDLVVANEGSNNVSVLRNLGNGTFANAVAYAVGTSPVEIAVANFDGVNGPDLAVTNAGSASVSLRYNSGTGTFGGTATTLNVGSEPWGIVAADLDGTPAPDLAVTNARTSTVSVLRNNGGTFAAAENYAVGGRPHGLVAGEFNGDNHLDLAVNNASSDTVSLLRNSGSGQNFATTTISGVGDAELGLEAADLNGDHRTDLAVDTQGSLVTILLQQ